MGNCSVARTLPCSPSQNYWREFYVRWFLCCGCWNPGDLAICGLRSQTEGIPVSDANGIYFLHGEHHGFPVFRHATGRFFVYFWDARDGPTWCGWWLGPSVGSSIVWGYCPGPGGVAPPLSGWRVPWNHNVDPRVRLHVSGPSKLPSSRNRPQKLRAPTWISQINTAALAALPKEDQTVLHTCCICLDPLWTSRPSVFLVNLQRLCPHYFCFECAQRIIGEGTTFFKILEENLRLCLIDGLAVVVDARGEQMGDLVWRANGLRVSEGEFAVLMSQLARFGEPEVGMELRFAAGQAVVFRNGQLFGQLLRSKPKLQQVSQIDFDEEGLGGVLIGDNAAHLRDKYTVLHAEAGDSDTWACERCTMLNPSMKFRCHICNSAPPRPAKPPDPSRPLMAADLAALRSRFAVRPRINWAVHLQCPLCRAKGCAALAPLPDLRTEPQAFFHVADLEGRGHLSPVELAQALTAVLPVSPEVLRLQLEGNGPPAKWASPTAPSGVSLEDFLREGGIAHWAAQHCSELERLAVHDALLDPNVNSPDSPQGKH